MREPVKGKTEAGRQREQRARATRARVVQSAVRLFIEHGYSATTVIDIARDAGVAPATIYQAFGSKNAVLARALDTTIAGDHASAALLDRDWVRQAREAPTKRARLAAVLDSTAAIAVRTAALKEVMRDAAATDPGIRELIDNDERQRRVTQRSLVEDVIGADTLPPGMTVDRATDTFFLLVNSRSYTLAHASLGWDESTWKAWLLQSLSLALFGDEATV